MFVRQCWVGYSQNFSKPYFCIAFLSHQCSSWDLSYLRLRNVLQGHHNRLSALLYEWGLEVRLSPREKQQDVKDNFMWLRLVFFCITYMLLGCFYKQTLKLSNFLLRERLMGTSISNSIEKKMNNKQIASSTIVNLITGKQHI